MHLFYIRKIPVARQNWQCYSLCMRYLSNALHRLFRLPYKLHVRYKRIKNPLAPTFLLVHGLADTGDLWEPLLENLPKNANYVAVDLLGHGRSKAPSSKVYSAYQQARNLKLTCWRLGIVGPVTVIGHSFGSLVAIEFARHYPRQVKQLVLCAPPIYRDPVSGKFSKFNRESILRDIYQQLLKKPRAVIAAYNAMSKMHLVGFSKISLNQDNFEAFTETLRAGIISQSASKNLAKISIPTNIIYGAVDPVLVPSNFAKLKLQNPNVSVHMIPTGHQVTKITLKTILKLVK